ncbi:substrate-binding domain-containing protein [Rosenbergiella collisarenosi]|uniref:substrate-binding domain-containing protein n=1 Tax=Rosenbergiella collisarenosi TaxID=1544695 RepID=UPI003BAB8A33
MIGIPYPALTTIHQLKDTLGQVAIDLLLHRIEEKKGGSTRFLGIPPESKVRTST